MSLVRYNPMNEIHPFHNTLGRLFNEPFFTDERTNWQPAVDIQKKNGKMLINAELPGVNKDDISIDLDGNVLTLKGEKKDEKEVNEENVYRRESFRGTFQRSFTVNENVNPDDINAHFKDGVLKIEIPHTEEENRRQIEVK
ncbi:MAG: Hsp20/alpha crystallin family protein [Desulfarculaceae bacterium]|nr:Hsp20/alpha crystallin family protein [Desulfarculaceae bacterium]